MDFVVRKIKDGMFQIRKEYPRILTRAPYAVKESAQVFFLQSQIYEFIEIAHIDHTMV